MAFANGELTAADILDIEEIEVVDPVEPPVDPEKIRTEIVANFYSTGESMDRFGSFSLTHQVYEELEESEEPDTEEPGEREPIPTVIELSLQTDVLAEFTEEGDLCTLQRTTYGDMRSFISYSSAPGSYGLDVPLVEPFICSVSDETTASETSTFELVPVDGEFTLKEVLTFNGRGLILRNLNSTEDIGFGVMSQLYLQASFNNTAKDICALC